MKFFNIALVLVFAAIAYSATSVSLENPANGYSSQSSTVQFSFSLSSDQTDVPFTCTLYIDGNSSQSGTVPLDTTTIFTASGIASGQHSWYVHCQDSFNNEQADSQTRSFSVSLPPQGTSVSLELPSSGYSSQSSTVQFSFSLSSDQTDVPFTCSLYIDGDYAQSGTVPLDTTTIFTASGIASGQHSWYVHCQDAFNNAVADSATRPFSVSLASGGGSGGSSGGSTGGTIGSPGSGGTSGGGAKNTSVIPKPLPKANQSAQPPPAPPSEPAQVLPAIIYAPADGYVNATVQIALTSQGGRPLSGVSVLVRMPDGATIRIVTDSNGRASFSPPSEGVYTYRATGYSLSGSPQTRVTKAPYTKEPQLGDWISEASANALPFIAVLAVVALLAGAYVFFTKKPDEGQ